MATVVPQSVLDAIGFLRKLPAITRVSDPVEVRPNFFEITADFCVELPSRAKLEGQSATGVLATEPVVFEFGESWPTVAPKIGLRKDFPRNLPHINPYTEGDYVRPCVHMGSLSELMHQDGFESIVDQIVDWLHKAAAGTLMNPLQGWEPTRRDESRDTVEFDADSLVTLISQESGIFKLPATFMSLGTIKHVVVYPDVNGGKNISYKAQEVTGPYGLCINGVTSTFVAIPPKDDATREPPVFDEYEPETVKNVPDLLEKARRYKIDDAALINAINAFYISSIKKSKGEPAWPGGFCLVVVLAIRRPIKLISSYGRTIELLPYIIHHAPTSSEKKSLKLAEAKPAYHLQCISPMVLRETSGTTKANPDYPLVWLGLGSLGSKLALHLAKSGFGSHTMVDNDIFSPHNAARHALWFMPDHMFLQTKVYLMAEALAKLGHRNIHPIFENAITVLSDEGLFKKIAGLESLIVDSTASLQVFNAVCSSTLLAQFSGRYARTAMLSEGRVAFIAIEGPKRSSRIDDLMAYFYAQCRINPKLRAKLGEGEKKLGQVFVGQNCSSITTVMPDSRISRAAASTALKLEQWLQAGFPVQGSLSYGVEDVAEVGMSWETLTIDPSWVMHTPSDGGWEVRILANVVEAIEQDVRKWGKNETGGPLLGRVYPGRRCIVIGDVVDAPPDSKRAPTRFTLGVEGLDDSLKQAHKDTFGHLIFVGTWHSHPAGGGLSSIDRDTLRNFSEAALGLSTMVLVWTPTGLLCEVMTAR